MCSYVHTSSLSLHFHIMSARTRSSAEAPLELISSTAESIIMKLCHGDFTDIFLHLVHDKMQPMMHAASVFEDGTSSSLSILKNKQPSKEDLQVLIEIASNRMLNPSSHSTLGSKYRQRYCLVKPAVHAIFEHPRLHD